MCFSDFSSPCPLSSFLGERCQLLSLRSYQALAKTLSQYQIPKLTPSSLTSLFTKFLPSITYSPPSILGSIPVLHPHRFRPPLRRLHPLSPPLHLLHLSPSLPTPTANTTISQVLCPLHEPHQHSIHIYLRMHRYAF